MSPRAQRLLHDALKTAEVALVHTRNQPVQRPFVLHLLQFKNPMFSAVPENHTHFIGRPQCGKHALCAIASYLVAVGKLHAVHDEHNRAAGQDLLAVQFHADRQRGFEWRIAVTASRVGLVATDADQAYTEIAHGTFEKILPFGAKIARSYVANEDGVVTLHFGE